MTTFDSTKASLDELLANHALSPDLVRTQETTQERILAFLREDPTMTRKGLANRIGIAPDGIKYHLNKLRDAGRIRNVGPTKKSRWEVLGDVDE